MGLNPRAAFFTEDRSDQQGQQRFADELLVSCCMVYSIGVRHASEDRRGPTSDTGTGGYGDNRLPSATRVRQYSGMSRNAEVIVLAPDAHEVMEPLTRDDAARSWCGRFVPIHSQWVGIWWFRT
jgi:hypothetical protein